MRLDYQPTGAHRLTGRLLLDHYNLIEPCGTFIGSQMPTVPTDRMRPGRNVQINHYWTLEEQPGQRGEVQLLGQRPAHPAGGRRLEALDLRLPVPAALRGRRHLPDSIPNVDLTAATRRSAAPTSRCCRPTWDYSFIDNITWIKGEPHAEGRGASASTTRRTRTAARTTRLRRTSTPTGNTNTTGNAFADALLGNFRTYHEAQLDPIGYFRF